MNKVIQSPFHRGEKKIQARLGVSEKMEQFGRQVIRDYMPEQHQQFFTQLPFVLVAHADDSGFPWASILFNQSPFISSAHNQHLLINAQPIVGDPLANNLNIGKHLGLLGIELATRRRNRLSAYINHVSAQGIELTIKQAFGNCPQYIQKRAINVIDAKTMPVATTERLSQFDEAAMQLITNSDTFFVASYLANNRNTISEGADVSHRGGKAGFVRVDDEQTLTIPDYLGNFHFNTLGNFVENPQTGLLFIDFENGHLLTLTGSVEILWDSPDTKFFAGAERLWAFRLNHGFWLKNVLPLRWKLEGYSPNTLLTGSWKEAKATQKAERLKHHWQAYQIVKIVEESSIIKSFYLHAPANQKPSFKSGQFLTLKARVNNKEEIRTYTVSSAPADHYFRISVKQQGVFSNFLHQQMAVGDKINVKAPMGAFTFDDRKIRPVVLISAGVGITPMISIARYVLQEGIRTRAMQPLIIICSARNTKQRAFFAELNEISEASAGKIKVFWVLSQAEAHLQLGDDYHYDGRLSKRLLEKFLTSNDYDVYLCGPNAFMQDQYNSLRALGIQDAHIFTEAFGVSSLVRACNKITSVVPIAKEAVIRFDQSQREQAWSPEKGTLLEFAESHGLTPEYGCRKGECGACKVKLLSGRIVYKQSISYVLDDNEILLCCAVPAMTENETISYLEIEL